MALNPTPRWPLSPCRTRLGWIGTGVMGLSMAGHLIDQGYAITVYNRTQARAQPLLDRGAVWTSSPRVVAERSEILFTMIGFPRDVREVYLRDDGILQGAKVGSIVVDMTTTEPSLAQEIYAAACWTLDNLAPRILQRNFDLGFFVEHFIKDMGIALDEARRMGLALPGLALVHQLYLAVKAQGHGRCGTHALMRVLEQMAQTEVAGRSIP